MFNRFQLIYIAFNMFFSLLTQQEQVRCFRSVSEHLLEGGLFLIEAFVPDLNRFEDDQTIRVSCMTGNRVQLEVSQHNPVEQQVNSRHVFLSEEGVRIYPVKLRYAWPSELDLMAQLAGMRLKNRWGTWEKGVFTRESKSHVSLYEKY